MSTALALPVVQAADLESSTSSNTWLVHSLWAPAAVGLLGGAPKCCKSWLALDFALSVASGTPCLGRFAVPALAPALLFMAEDSAAVVKERLEGLCRQRSLVLAELALQVITAPSLRIDLELDRQRLRETLRQHRPQLLVLDPFVRLHRIDENHAGEVSELLGFLRSLQREFAVAILVVHHARKNAPAGTAPGQGLRGSGDLHAWGDSNLYLRRVRGDLVLTIEHRAAPAPEAVGLRLVTTDPRAVHLAVVSSTGLTEAEPPIEDRVLQTLREFGPLRRHDLREQLRVRNERLGHALERLAGQKLVTRDECARIHAAVPASPP